MAWLAMPRSAKRRKSRRLSLSGMPTIAAAPNVARAAIRNRALSTISGGQSAMESLAAANADDQSRQNAATSSGNGSRKEPVAGDGTAILAVRMVTVLSCEGDRLAHCHLEIK